MRRGRPSRAYRRRMANVIRRTAVSRSRSIKGREHIMKSKFSSFVAALLLCGTSQAAMAQDAGVSTAPDAGVSSTQGAGISMSEAIAVAMSANPEIMEAQFNKEAIQ